MLDLIKCFVMVSILSGCAATLPRANTEVPASLLVACQPLEQLQGLTGKDLITNITNNAAIYHSCSDVHNALVEAVKIKK